MSESNNGFLESSQASGSSGAPANIQKLVATKRLQQAQAQVQLAVTK